MGIFVDIAHSNARDATNATGAVLFKGEIISCGRGSLADYVLRTGSPSNHVIVATLDRYAQCTEPAMALLARMLERCDPAFLADEQIRDSLRVVLAIGADIGSAIDQERVEIAVGLHFSGVKFDTRFRHLVAVGPASRGHSVRDALCTGMRIALGWHQGVPPVSAPLSGIQVHTSRCGRLLVRLEEMPWHTRLLVQERFRLRAEQEDLDADHWLAFIEEVP